MARYINQYPRFHEWIRRHDLEFIRIHFVTMIIALLFTTFGIAYYGDDMFHCATEWSEHYTEHTIAFFIMLHAVLFVYVYIIKIFGTIPKTAKERAIALIPTTIALALNLYLFRGQYGVYSLLDMVFVFSDINVFIQLLIPAIIFLCIICYKKMIPWIKNKQYLEYPWFCKLCCFTIIPILSMLLCEYPLKNDITIAPMYLPMNIFYWIIIVSTIWLITSKPKIAITVSLIASWFIGVVNYELQYWRDDYIMLSDIKALRTAVNVAGNYSPKLGLPIIITTVIMVFALCIVWSLPKAKYHWTDAKPFKTAVSIVGTIFIIVSTIISWNTGFLYLNANGMDWDTNAAVDRRGYPLYFLANLNFGEMEKPANYNTDGIETALSLYTNDTQETHKEPTIIIIQNEAWADLRIRANIETNQPIMPTLDSLTNNTQKGFLTTSVDFGPTTFTEFESVTSMTLRYLNNINPFLQMLRYDTPSIATLLHEQENPYKCIFFHPYHASGYNREDAYTKLGFDQTIFYENWANKEVNGLDIVTDNQDVKDIISIYEQNKSSNPDQPLFIYNVTIAGHSAYTNSTYEQMPIEITNFDADVELTHYMNHLWNTDQAIKTITDYFSEKDEDVIIVMFGDHNPHMQDEAANQLLQQSRYDDAHGAEAIRGTYHVPYFIWANFDIPEYDGLGGENRENPVFNQMSVNYMIPHVLDIANVKLSSYYKFQLDLLKKYPVLSIPYAYDADGNPLTETDNESQFYKDAEILYWLEYNALMDNNNKLWNCFKP